MYGGPQKPGDDMAERITDNWIQQNVPGGLNSKLLKYIYTKTVFCFRSIGSTIG